MAQFFQVVNSATSPEKVLTGEELQTLYPGLLENQATTAVRYVFNEEATIPSTPVPLTHHTQSKPIILATSDGGEQFMVVDSGQTIPFQGQAIATDQHGQQIAYFMEATSDDVNTVGLDPAAQPLLLNHTQQKLIMVQQQAKAQPTMVIQHPPALVQRHIPKTINQQQQISRIQTQSQLQARMQSQQQQVRVQSPLQLQPPQLVATPRLVVTQQQQTPPNTTQISRLPGSSGIILSPNINRPTLARGTAMQNRPNMDSTPVRSPRLPLTNRTIIHSRTPTARPQIRGGIVQSNNNTNRMGVNQQAVRNASQNRNSPMGQQTQQRPRLKLQNTPLTPAAQASLNAQAIEGNNGIDAVALADGRIVSVSEYKQMLLERKKTEMLNTVVQKSQPKTTSKPPVNRKPSPQTKAAQNCPSPATVPPPPLVAPLRSNATVSNPQPNTQLPAILRNFVPPPEIKEIISKTQHTAEFKNSIRMFVLLASGEQRLITFTMPKEDCTIQEVLEQVGVPIQPDTKIATSETNVDGINLVVTVGITDDDENEVVEPEESPKPSPPQHQQQQVTVAQTQPPPPPPPPPKPPTPELQQPDPTEQSKYIPGMLAVCTHCGLLSDDFNRCVRCKNKLPESCKAMPAAQHNMRKAMDQIKHKPSIALHLKNSNIANPKVTSAKKKPPAKPKLVDQEPVVLTLSSDDEGDDKSTPSIDELIKKAESQDSILKEPTVADIQQSSNAAVDESTDNDTATACIYCRTVRIGSYRFSPAQNIIVTNKEVILKAPCPKDPREIKTLRIDRGSVVKVLVNFQKILPVIFYYVSEQMAETIRNELGMTEGGEYYFDPCSSEEAFKRITLLPELISDEIRVVFRQIYNSRNLMDELSAKEANNILIRTCPREATKSHRSSPITTSSTDVRQLLIYPEGRGGISINTEDFLCLAQDQFLNDVIIDFYLKYVVLNLSKEEQDKIHVFSTFFYKRLTTKPTKPTRRSHPTELDSTLTQAQKRHARVKNWTKNVNLFEKNFIVVPINENAHWFLAIICFPSMNGPHTIDGKPHIIGVPPKKKKSIPNTGSNVTITQIKVEKTETVSCDDPELSDKDEADGDDSELESGEESEEPVIPIVPQNSQKNNVRIPVQQPCILIFDSLAGASRSKVVATLREYLSCEHKSKLGIAKVFTKEVMKGACPKVPQQTNYTDCGLYLLQYVESFLTNPIKDYHIPMKELKEWFDEITVTRKREDIAKLIKELMLTYKKDVSILPNLLLPTQNGEIVERPPEEEDEEELEDEEEEEEDGREMLNHHSDQVAEADSESVVSSSMDTVSCAVSEDAVPELMDESTKSVVTMEARSRDMLYLKTKRISRHLAAGDGSEAKKAKLVND